MTEHDILFCAPVMLCNGNLHDGDYVYSITPLSNLRQYIKRHNCRCVLIREVKSQHRVRAVLGTVTDFPAFRVQSPTAQPRSGINKANEVSPTTQAAMVFRIPWLLTSGRNMPT